MSFLRAVKSPLAVSAISGFVIASAGDLLCQSFERNTAEKTGKAIPQWNLRRTLDMGVIRAVVMAPFLSVYFPFLNKLSPGTTVAAVAKRVIADQCIGAPISIVLTFGSVALLQGKPESFTERVAEQLVPTWQTGACYWPFVHSLNFRFVPLQYQAIVAHVASLWWNAVLSYRSNTSLRTEQLATGQAISSGDSVVTIPTLNTTLETRQ